MKPWIHAVALILIIIILQVPAQPFLVQPQPPDVTSESKVPGTEIAFAKTWSSSEGYMGKGIAADSNGNIYIVGSGWPGVILLSYDSTGQLLWERQWIGGENDRGNGIAVDSEGSIYVTGMTYSRSTLTDHLLLLKFGANGSLVWQKSWGSAYVHAVGYAVAVDPSTSSIYVTGTEADSLVLLKFGSEGSLDWATRLGGIGGDVGQAVAVDSSGVHVAGGTYRHIATRFHDAIVLKFNSNGNLVWTRSWGGASHEWAYGIALDSAHNVYVTGDTGPDSDVFLLNLNSTGSLIWQRTWGGSAYDEGLAIASNTSGGIYLTGLTVSFGAGGTDIFLLNFDVNGTLISQQTWGGHDHEEADGVAVGSDGGVLITGLLNGPPYRSNSTSSNLGYPTDDLLSLELLTETAPGTLGDPAGAAISPLGSDSFNGQNSIVLLKYGTPEAPVPLTYQVSFVANASGTITFYWSSYRNRETNYFTPGTYAIQAKTPACFHFCFGPEYVFSHWRTAGGVWVDGACRNPARATVMGSGTLEAVFTDSGARIPECLISNPIFVGAIVVLTSATLVAVVAGRRPLKRVLHKSWTESKEEVTLPLPR